MTLTVLVACHKEAVKPAEVLNSGIENNFAEIDTLDCEKQITHEYDILAVIYKMQISDAISVITENIGSSLYETIEEELGEAYHVGIETWLDDYAGSSLSTDLKEELADLARFIQVNAIDQDFNDQIQQLISQYLTDNRFDVEEKNTLVASARTARAMWEFERCEESELATRGGPDDAICIPVSAISTTTTCGSLTIGIAVVVGAVVGFVATGNPFFAVLGAIAAIGVALVTNPGSCPPVECDDCHHAYDIVTISDFAECKFTGAEAFGAFEYAENWQWNVVWSSGTYSTTTDLPRVSFPGNFDPDEESFTVRCITLCDGQSIPDNNPNGFLQTFSGHFTPVPWILTGNVVVDDSHDFRFESSATFGQLSSPSWSTTPNVTLVDSGFENGVFFAEYNFSNVTTATATITLTLHDDCAGGNRQGVRTVVIIPV